MEATLIHLIFKDDDSILTIPLPLSSGLYISATTAILKLTLPLAKPPMILAITNNVKFLESAQIT